MSRTSNPLIFGIIASSKIRSGLNFTASEAELLPNISVTIAETTGNQALRGKGASTLVWRTKDIKIAVPGGTGQAREYGTTVIWTLTAKSEK